MKVLLMMATVAALIGVPRANATIEIRLIDSGPGGGDTGWITSASNNITFNGTVGNFTINVSTAIKADGVNPFLDLNSIDQTTSASPGTLTIEAIANGYLTNSPGFQLEVGGTSSIGNTSFSAYGGNTNQTCPAGVNGCSPTVLPAIPPMTLINTQSFTTSPFSGSGAGAGNTVNPYSLAIVATITATHAGSASFDAGINSVPEPTSVVLFGGVLLLSMTLLRKKLRKA